MWEMGNGEIENKDPLDSRDSCWASDGYEQLDPKTERLWAHLVDILPSVQRHTSRWHAGPEGNPVPEALGVCVPTVQAEAPPVSSPLAQERCALLGVPR